MRRMAFAMTTPQVRTRTKTVTRRQGWSFLNVGDMIQPVVKAQGLRKGERQEKIGGPVRVVSVRRESVSSITSADCALEGFPDMNGVEFVRFYCEGNGCVPTDRCTRIEFEYLEESME